MLEGRSETNPADLVGVVVYHPKSDPDFKYLPDIDQVLDVKTGERFWMKTGHNLDIAQYGLVSPTNGLIIRGGYYVHSVTLASGIPAMVYDVVSTARSSPESPRAVPTSYDVGRLANFIRAKAKHGKPNSPVEVIVVDSRPIRKDSAIYAKTIKGSDS